jgi:Protein of unknown function with HXXEE motif
METTAMSRITRLFLLLTVIGPIHMAEQMLTGIEEFHMLREQLGGYYALFAPAHADVATVGLITIVWTVVSLLFYAVLAGGTARLAVLGVFGAFGVHEAHHVLEASVEGGYDPGLVTCVPYAIAGYYLVKAVVQEYRRMPATAAAARP